MLVPLALALLLAPARIDGDVQTDPPFASPAALQRAKDDEALGAKIAAEVNKDDKPTEDKKMQARVERIGNELAAIANAHHLIALWGDKRYTPLHYRFTVIKGSDVNASLPGGYVYVYEGLVKYVESDDELAGVLAHEISHAAFRHVPTMIKKSRELSLITLPLIIASIFAGPQAAILGPGAQLTQQAIGSGWSVDAEKAADYGGFQIMRAASTTRWAC